MAKKAADNGQTKVEKYSQTLKVILSKEEIADRADRAASILAERDSKEEDMKAAQKHAKAAIESLESELRRLSGEVRTKSTYENVACERRFDYVMGRVQEIRTDTMEVLCERELTDSERQRELPFESN